MSLIEIIKRYYTNIYNLCLFKLSYDKADAENCTQEIFIVLINKWEKVQNKNIYPWLLKTTHYTIKNYQRKKKTYDKVVSLQDCIELPSDDGEVIDLVISDGEIEEYKQRILAELSSDERELYKAYFEDKLSYAQIAEKMGLKYATVQARTIKLKNKLTESVKDTFCITGASLIALRVIIALIGEG